MFQRLGFNSRICSVVARGEMWLHLTGGFYPQKKSWRKEHWSDGPAALTKKNKGEHGSSTKNSVVARSFENCNQMTLFLVQFVSTFSPASPYRVAPARQVIARLEIGE